MSKVKIPTLSKAGWVEDLSAKATKLLEYFLVSEDDQTEFYRGAIASFPALVNEYGNNPGEMASKTESVLLHYYRRSFEQVDVRVTVSDIDSNDAHYNMDVDLTIREDGVIYSLGSLLELSGGKLLGHEMK